MRGNIKGDPVGAAVDLPGVDDMGVGYGGEIVRVSSAEQITLRVKVQDAGVRGTPGRQDTILDRSDGAPGAPHVIDDQGAAITQQVILRELQEPWSGF